MIDGVAPDALGIGLRPVHFDALRAGAPPELGFLELIVDNFVGASALPRQNLRAVRGAPVPLPVVGHSVGFDVLGTDPLRTDHLARVARFLAEAQAPLCTDHLCFSAVDGQHLHDLLPAPTAAALVPHAAARIRAITAAVGVPFGVENVSSYVRYAADEMPEYEFLRRVVDAADCALLLDVNNIVVSAHNHGFSPRDYLDAVPFERVAYVHVAGHSRHESGLRHDTHDDVVADEVWDVYADAWRRGGPFPTLLEWDGRIPPLAELIACVAQARAHQRGRR